ncbi:T9SS type A sorting domain-containing protein [Dyadobacter sp. CY343]|uniref:T9SS type A sorting domain-containing protein n=1 Tax=Dyadobacter sp. CY343 TaxID=2907299 RepID=UPI001F2F13C0|nr:T9SS type A sorting domain-containing protein [Dyadobacter sp. CY343]MCE7063160.1 right-handed parallel beta-helix repeat-containing protein [Dyadobacter sp. CY343]
MIRYSLVQGETSTSNGNISGYVDPVFRDAAQDDYGLQACSPVVNKGSNTYFTSGQTPDLSLIVKDITGSGRFYNNGIVDMGAYEFQADPLPRGVAGVWYVTPGGSGAGTSWACAQSDLQRAINSASSGDQVWVAAGTFILGSGPRFFMKEGVKIYGGFAGNETSLDQRDLSVTANKSTLSGNNGAGVLVHSGLKLTSAAVLDGFTITGSNTAPAIQNGSGSSPKLVNLTITGNQYTGMNIYDSSPELINCSFIGNVSPIFGGGLLISSASPILTNCLISGNTSALDGGGIFVADSKPVITNCTIVRNIASGQGGGIFNTSGQAFPIRNSIVYENNTGLVNVPQSGIKSSLVQVDGNAGISVDPLFVDANAGNFRLQPCSPAINAGFNYFQEGQRPDISGITADLDRNPRVREHIVDLGAYEFGGARRELANDNDEASADIAGDYVLTSADCQLIAYLNPGGVVNGTGAVSGTVKGKVWVASTQPDDFVKRHYQITPFNNPDGAAARVTLFFTQQEFDDFNAVNPTKLPLNAADIENNKANLRIEKRSGVSNDGSGLPDSYPGNVSTFTPAQANGKVEWNADAQYWEVTFDVTGFSGFFIKTKQSALPLNLISFTATKETGSNLLQWNTASEVNTNNFEIQRSGDAKSFLKIATVDAAGSGDNHYSYHDQNNFDGTIYYRLKMSDRDGTFTYSKITSLNEEGKLNAIYPNPASETVTFQVSDALLRTSANLYDITGRHMQSLDITATKQQISIKSLPSGLYILKFADGTSEQFVKM